MGQGMPVEAGSHAWRARFQRPAQCVQYPCKRRRFAL